MKKKKILIIHPALAPYRVDFFNSLNEHFDAKFYFFNENLLNQKFDQKKIKKLINFKCYYLKTGFNTSGRSFRFGTAKIIKEFNPDLIICPEYNLINLSIIANKIIYNKKYKIVTICDDSVQVAQSVSYFKKIVRSFFLRNIDAVIFTHQAIVDWYKENLKPKASLLIFPIIRKEDNYLKQLEDSRIIAESYILNYNLQNRKVLLFVGRLTKVKNIEILLDAFLEVNKISKDTILIIVGSGELDLILRNKIETLGLTKTVLMPGRFEGNDLLAWYNLANIFILPSISEPFGAVINEALLAGCYVLSSKFAGGASLIKVNVNGNIFDPLNKNEIIETIMLNLDKGNLFIRQKGVKKSLMLNSYKTFFEIFINKLYKI